MPDIVIPLNEAISIAEKALDAQKDTVEPKLSFVQVPNGSLVYAHQFQVRNDDKNKWFLVSVDVQTGQIIEVVDYYSKAMSSTFHVTALPKKTPLEGFASLVNPANDVASPWGWDKIKSTIYPETQGNNADVVVSMFNIFPYRAQAKNGRTWYGAPKKDIENHMEFETDWKADEGPYSEANKKTSAVQLFYILNKMHDISYHYGFTEKAGNFQQYNIHPSGGHATGKGNDRVVAHTISRWGKNNANFATPPGIRFIII